MARQRVLRYSTVLGDDLHDAETFSLILSVRAIWHCSLASGFVDGRILLLDPLHGPGFNGLLITLDTMRSQTEAIPNKDRLGLYGF